MNRGIRGKGAAIVAGIGLALGIAQGASAADFCIDYLAQGQRTIVGTGFKLPKSGKCKPFHGFTTYQGLTRAVSGAGCVASDGKHVRFGLVGVAGLLNLFYTIDLPLPLGPAGTISIASGDGAVQLASAPLAGPCPAVQQIP